MLIVDQLRKDEPKLRTVAIVILAGLLLLAAGLWRVQVLANRRYARSEEAQSVRLVRVPAARGRILDRNGDALAENRAGYDVNLYLEELRPSFLFEYTNQILPGYFAANPGAKAGAAVRMGLQETARLTVYSNTVLAVSTALGTPLPVSGDRFLRHYRQDLALPLTVVENLTPAQMALFFERCVGLPGVDFDVEAIRHYPQGRLAAHVLGHLRRADEADNDPEPLVFRYRLHDFQGVAGIEAKFDETLRGQAGVKALKVNSQGYRHTERILYPTEAGDDIRLTLDISIQTAAELALSRIAGSDTRGAVVVMDVRNGDLLALVSAPAFDPNEFLGGITPEAFARLNDEKLRPQMNRAVSGAYPPGSIFKVLVALAALDAGVLDPAAIHTYKGYWEWPMGSHTPSIDDTAPPGDYDFKRAFKLSSNAYFIDHGLRAGRGRIVAMAKRFNLGKPLDFTVGPETAGFLPDDTYMGRLRAAREPWTDGDTAQFSIGQGPVTVSPLQMAVMTAAVANGGHVLQPRLKFEPRPGAGAIEEEGHVRAETGVQPAHLALMRSVMLADVEERDGTGHEAAVEGMRICGKTGTAEIKRGRVLIDKVTWFVSFAPYEAPRYTVVVVVESGGSGGRTCAPVARQIYQALLKRDRNPGQAAPEREIPFLRRASTAGQGIRVAQRNGGGR